MLFWSLVVILIGTAIELVPTFLVKSNVPTIASVQPYTPLELEGRDLYIREGCNNCHSQLIRPFRSETERYGDYSKSGEYVYDHPFLWGSKRTGPDLHREGVGSLKKGNDWHYSHLVDPQSTSTGSIMPRYDWLATQALNTTSTKDKINAMRKLGVPYPAGYENVALADLQKQADEIAQSLNKSGIQGEVDDDNNIVTPLNKTEIVAIIAYLQRMGKDVSPDAGQAFKMSYQTQTSSN